jgi:acetoacetyl-CoA synthetase
MDETTHARKLWEPDAARRAQARITGYLSWLKEKHGREFADYESLWQWSVDEPEAFWRSVWDHFDLHSATPFERVLEGTQMPGARWFPGATLNFAEHVFRHARTDQPALVYESEAGRAVEIGWEELRRQVAALARTLRALDVRAGDRVVGYLPNVPEAVVGFLACASIGAIWSVAAPDMGVRSVLDRFRQIEPAVLIACDGQRYSGAWRDRAPAVNELLAALPTVRALIVVSHVDGARADLSRFDAAARRVLSFEEAAAGEATLDAQPLPFDHPLWIVYSSGTTGLPKAIVHGHGGVMLNTLVGLALHNDVHASDRLMWLSSTGWIVWNVQVSALLLGATVVLTDGAAAGGAKEPDWATLWRLAGRQRVNIFGLGCAYLLTCMKHGVVPREAADLSQLRSLGATGSPLPGEGYRWVYDSVGRDVHLMVVSGGTDIAGAFVTALPTLPVYEGEMQCRSLGAAVHAFDESGRPVLGETGELVCTQPLPSMPLFFWGDRDNKRYRESYFDSLRDAAGRAVWRHGDWIRLNPRPEAVGAVIYGRSDATINRLGLRLGTSELYSAIETVPEVLDSLVVDLEYLGRPSCLLLFVALRPGTDLSAELSERLRAAIRNAVSPRFVPDEIHQIADVPRNLTGKKLELPIRRLLLGEPVERVIQRDAVANPASIDWFVEFAAQRAGTR